MRPVRPVLAALAAAAAVLAAAGAAGATTLEKELDATYPLAAGGTVELANTNGKIVLDSWDRAEVRVRAVKRVSAGSREDAEKGLAALEVKIAAAPDRLAIETRTPREDSGFFQWLIGDDRQYQVRYHLTVPRGVHLEVETVNGGIELTDLEGDLRLTTVNGGIEAAGTRGAVRATTTNGRIDVELAEVAAGADLEFVTTNGHVGLTLPDDVRAHLTARTTNGGIASDFPVAVQGRHSKRVEADLNGGGGGRLTVVTTNGGIAIRKL